MSPPAASFATQPYAGSDVVAFVLLLLAAIYASIWRRDHERGLGSLALGTALVGVWAAANRLHLPTDRFLSNSPWALVVPTGIAALSVGVVDYLGLDGAARRRALWLTLLPLAALTLAYFAIVLFGARVPRIMVNLLVGGTFAVLGVLAWQARRTEPEAGHALLAVALWGVPAIAIAMALGRVDSVALRYWGMLPILILGVTLLTVCLLRRRRALESEVRLRRDAEAGLAAMNASLEQVVAQRTADLQEIVAGLETFNRSVSHDLRGSLGGIAGFARLADEALRGGNPEVAREALPLIADQAERSVRLVNALLELAHAGDGSLRTRKVSLRQVVDDALSHLAAAAGGSAIPKIEIGALPEATVDPDMMQRVFANLIGNAIKFTRGAHDGHVVIDAARGGDGVVVSVRDNGVGFEASAALRIFEPFFRAHGRAFDGDGVGLSIVRRAVERHGGRVWAESAPGAGATFFFTLPA